MNIKKIITSNIVFGLIAIIFIGSTGFFAYKRGGKDLKVGLYGISQVSQKKSPYDNPLDPSRPLFRYAPGFTLLQSPFVLKNKMTSPYIFDNIGPSVIAWFTAGILSLILSGIFLLKLLPAASKESNLQNLKLSFLMSLPLIGYELTNGQNKLIALCFMLAALLLFKNNRLFLSALLFNIALTIYIPLFAFAFYFFIKCQWKFLKNFIIAALVIFIIIPSLAYGFNFNLFLLQEWFMRCLKPFFLTTSYSTYIDLRTSSHSLPSAFGRLFVDGHTNAFKYYLSPFLLHILIRLSLATILAVSCFTTWKNSKDSKYGLQYAVFFILALLMPQYCIYYTWAWLFVVYFAVFNFISQPDTREKHKKLLLIFTFTLFLASMLISINFFNRISMLFWATLALWGSMVFVLKTNE